MANKGILGLPGMGLLGIPIIFSHWLVLVGQPSWASPPKPKDRVIREEGRQSRESLLHETGQTNSV